MPDLEDQIKSWADATMARAGSLDAPAPATRDPRHRGWWLAAAAVLLVVLVGAGLGMRADDEEHVRSDDPATTTTTTRPEGVVFQVLGVHRTSIGRVGDLEAAQTPAELDHLWNPPPQADIAPAPDVDFDRQVVVGITIPDDNCPPTLTEFIHDGGDVSPRFVESKEACEQPLVARTYVVALDWASTGDSFQLLFSGLRPEDEETTLQVVRIGTRTATSTTTTPSARPADLSIQQLGSGDDRGKPGTLRAAQTEDELRQLRVDAGVDDRPEVDLATHVALSITVLGRDCPATMSSDPPMLGAMTRTGAEIEPQFLPIPDDCETNDVPRTFLVAVPWSEIGDSFDLVLSSNLGGERDGRLHVVREHHDAEAPSKVTASLALDATTMSVGTTLKGTVTVVNDSGAPIEGSACGDYFIGSLASDDYQQSVFRNACAGPFAIPEGTSRYPISVVATVTGCTPAGVTGHSIGPACQADGSVPAFAPGEYEVWIDDPMHLVPAIDPATVTVTPAPPR